MNKKVGVMKPLVIKKEFGTAGEYIITHERGEEIKSRRLVYDRQSHRLRIEQFETPNGTRATLLEDLKYRITRETETIHIHIKAGFTYDGANIPRALWGLIGSPFTGRYRLASCVHDALYATHLLPKKLTEDIFYNIMRNDGVAVWRASLIYSGVLVGGFVAWNSHKHTTDEARKFVEVRIENNINSSATA